MKRTLMAIVCAAFLGAAASVARAADAPAAKPDCAEKQKAVDDANAAAKTAATADLSSCKEKKGKEKTDCEKPLKDKAKTDTKAAKDKAKEAKTALDCCKNPKKKGCSP
jgi:opacity protein-like surface antigen